MAGSKRQGEEGLPVAVIGAGPVGLSTALGLARHGIPFTLFEAQGGLHAETRAGTILTRTLEIFRRFGVADAVLARSLRLDEIGDIERATGVSHRAVRMDLLHAETRYPFVINLPQHHLEPVLADAVNRSGLGAMHLDHRLKRFEPMRDRVELILDTPQGEKHVSASYVLACDGGRSTVRELLGTTVEGESLPERYMLVDLAIDLDVGNPRDYPYLAYFADPREWMILVRQPHCWRFLFPLKEGAAEPSQDELRDKVLEFIGKVDRVRVIGSNIYRIHHRVAQRWRHGRVFLMGDAAHLITPMWGLGLNTGVLDASNLAWRLSWVMRGWAPDALLDGYEREQKPLALHGSGEMAEAARRYMARETQSVKAMSDNSWCNALTRGMLGVKLDVDGSGDWSLIKTESEPPLRPGDRVPDCLVHGADGREHRLHDLIDGRFAALHFADARRHPEVPTNTSPALAHYLVSRWDAPFESGVRDRALLDAGDRVVRRFGCPPNTIVLVRPDEHVAAIAPMRPGAAEEMYRKAVGADVPRAQ